MQGELLTSVPPDKFVATLGLRLPELGLVFTGRGHFFKRRDEVQGLGLLPVLMGEVDP